MWFFKIEDQRQQQWKFWSREVNDTEPVKWPRGTNYLIIKKPGWEPGSKEKSDWHVL